jgi:AcrR family transcriptional regulator
VTLFRASTGQPDRRDLRGRILNAASGLFLKQGIHSASVDAICQAASTNKMTFYRHFKSKDALVLELLEAAAIKEDLLWEALDRVGPDQRVDGIRGWLKHAAPCLGGGGRKGFVTSAAIELARTDHPAKSFLAEFDRKRRERLASMCASAGFPDVESLSCALVLLVDGAHAMRRISKPADLCLRFLKAGDAIIATYSRVPQRSGSVKSNG